MTDTKTIFENVPDEDMKRLITGAVENQVYGNPALAIDGNANDVETTNAISFSLHGKLYSMAADAAIDISSECAQFTTDALTTIVLADDYEAVYIFTVSKAGALNYVRSTPLAIASTEAHAIPDFDRDTLVCFAAVKVRNETGAAFVFGTTEFSDSTGDGITDTYYNLNNPFPGQNENLFGTPAVAITT